MRGRFTRVKRNWEQNGVSLQETFFVSDCDPLARWFDEEMVIDWNSAEYCAEVWLSLADWCIAKGYRALLIAIPNPSKLSAPLRDIVPGLTRVQPYRDAYQWMGIRLKKGRKPLSEYDAFDALDRDNRYGRRNRAICP
jgi:hypothetical protein